MKDGKKAFTLMSHETPSRRREVLAGSAAAGTMTLLGRAPAAAADGKKTFTILHTNDLHSNFIGMAPASDYSPFTLNDDATQGGFARPQRRAAMFDLAPEGASAELAVSLFEWVAPP